MACTLPPNTTNQLPEYNVDLMETYEQTSVKVELEF